MSAPPRLFASSVAAADPGGARVDSPSNGARSVAAAAHTPASRRVGWPPPHVMDASGGRAPGDDACPDCRPFTCHEDEGSEHLRKGWGGCMW